MKYKQRIIAIDPGANGGIAWVDNDDIVRAEKMPEGMTAQADFIMQLRSGLTGPMTAILEKVGTYVKGNSGPAAAKFARHCGNIEAALYVLGVQLFPPGGVAPQVWMKALGSLPKDKQERKRAIKECMARVYPHLTVTLYTADALGLLYWGMNRK